MFQIGTDWDEDEPEFPEQDGPVFLLGVCALMDALWVVIGEDSLGEIQGVLLPGDAELLECIGGAPRPSTRSSCTPAPPASRPGSGTAR